MVPVLLQVKAAITVILPGVDVQLAFHLRYDSVLVGAFGFVAILVFSPPCLG